LQTLLSVLTVFSGALLIPDDTRHGSTFTTEGGVA
jgi:hypothetical protein